MESRIPFEIKNAIINVCGKCFWYKQPLFDLLSAAGVPAAIIDRYGSDSKFPMIRSVLAELENSGEKGLITQKRILTELCMLRKVPDDNVPDMDAAVSALRTLKELAVENKLFAEKSKKEEQNRRKKMEARQERVAEKRQQLEALDRRFKEQFSNPDAQKRGYILEEILIELFEINGINCRKPYRTETEQIDLSFDFQNFGYLLEAKWTKELPNRKTIAGFKSIVDSRFAGTRGIFISINGFRTAAVHAVTSGVSTNIILMDGLDLTLILEGRLTLEKALRAKIGKAIQEGEIYFQLKDLDS